jgi:hypothetical protein
VARSTTPSTNSTVIPSRRSTEVESESAADNGHPSLTNLVHHGRRRATTSLVPALASLNIKRVTFTRVTRQANVKIGDSPKGSGQQESTCQMTW